MRGFAYSPPIVGTRSYCVAFDCDCERDAIELPSCSTAVRLRRRRRIRSAIIPSSRVNATIPPTIPPIITASEVSDRSEAEATSSSDVVDETVVVVEIVDEDGDDKGDVKIDSVVIATDDAVPVVVATGFTKVVDVAFVTVPNKIVELSAEKVTSCVVGSVAVTEHSLNWHVQTNGALVQSCASKSLEL